MAALGRFTLLLALAFALYGFVATLVARRRGDERLRVSGRRAAYAVLLAAVVANAVMLVAILSDDFSVAYVAENSSRATPGFFKVLSLWSADEGSLLLWNLILSGYVAAVAFRWRHRAEEELPATLAILFGVAAFYLVLVLGPTAPFAGLSPVPADGNGPLPLLQNHPLMAVHPPFLYLGYIGFTVPFAFALGAVLSGTASDRWLVTTKRWALVAWWFLTIGLLLGALWSYGVLGWGGYWAWDPVENGALLPWLMATAFIHSAMLQDRRGMLRVWNASLAVGTFVLVTFGSFITRGSILSSIHAFSRSLVGPMYLGLLMVTIVLGFGAIAFRASKMRSRGRIDSALSREAFFVGNNLVLVALTAIVLAGTVFPLIVEAVAGRKVSIGAPFFRQTTAPALSLLLFFLGAGPLLPWRRGRWARVRGAAVAPVAAATITFAALAAGGVRNVAALVGFALAAFALVANAGVVVRKLRGHVSGRPRKARAALGALARDRRAYGALVIHMGLAVLATGVIWSSSFATERQVTLAEGDTAELGGRTITYEGLDRREEEHRTVLVARATVREDGATGVVHPSLNLYPNAREPVGTPSIRYGAFQDFYSSLIGIEDGGTTATFRFLVNPGVTWIWAGGAVMVLAGLACLMPGAKPVPRPSPRPSLEAA
ncbi:MAG TPA: cytochrome c-type biogenesis CcmF C-terminal domain-containing protein [Actinomycetota bacterium]|nr:cytochrome c-type biogenesis CcmF C-terminal domain-containing protein [Actinomycetota bacterium]